MHEGWTPANGKGFPNRCSTSIICNFNHLRWRGTRLLDLGNSFDILDLKMSASLQNFQSVLLIGKPQPFGSLHAKQNHVARCGVPGRAMCSFPVKVISDSAFAPFGLVLLVKRWPAIMASRNAACFGC